jgi:hypothetical protein
MPSGCSPADLQPAAAARDADRQRDSHPGPRARRSFTPDFLNGCHAPRQITAGAPRSFSLWRFAAGNGGGSKDEARRRKDENEGCGRRPPRFQVVEAYVVTRASSPCAVRLNRANRGSPTAPSFARAGSPCHGLTKRDAVRRAPRPVHSARDPHQRSSHIHTSAVAVLTCSPPPRAWPGRSSRRTCRLRSRRSDRPSFRSGSPASPREPPRGPPAGPSRPWP